MPEPWLRGPIEGVPGLLQPVAHALVMSREDIAATCERLGDEEWWLRPSGVASIGFHVAHLSGSTDRLLTYARGEGLSDEQLRALAREREVDDLRPTVGDLLAGWDRTVTHTLEYLRELDERTLREPRGVGRAQLPSTVLGLLFHVAEHAARHTGQVVTTARVVQSSASPGGTF